MLLINLLGVLLIVAIIYWFWWYEPNKVNSDSNQITITVSNGVYSPAYIKVAANTPLTLNFNRQDSSPCAETVIFPTLELSETLSMGENAPIEIPALDAGEYAFHCQMQMYKGKLLVY
ncbi:cupredoxin domain-containing protein [Pseudoalteromonas sp. SK18]|uniref:cupredoxin domain-containing protein n=1 Tax=Pseudoalteromonas sp. SK18 TaxID=1938366 RepID=UPI00097731B0|nr:cupredoxin domain-containing protein [Pseudoalteromonas sp. SK18]